MTSLPGRRRRARTGTVLSFLVACALVPAVSEAMTVIVLPGSGTNLSAPFIQSARGFFVQRLPQRLRVIDFDRPPTPWPAPPAQAGQFALAMNAHVALTLHITHSADGSTHFQVMGYAVDGRRLCQIDEVTIGGPEVIALVAERLASRTMEALSGGAAAGGLSSKMVSRPHEPRRWGLGLRLGAMVPLASAGGQTIVLPGAGAFLFIDRARYLGEIFFEIADQTEGSAMAAGLGGQVPLAAGGTAPYVGAKLKWSRVKLGGRGASGVSVEPTLGMWWRQSSSLRIRLEAGYFVDLFEEREVDRLIVGSGEGHRGHGVQFSIGVAF